ncbi:hypothetical protein ABZ608_09420 [Streptomyces sp. NPDC013172]|uniref:hypothetical protein n=1 Tax=Streptomyces sp. NPDC013172 TaxID=3155009 RepID=UPI0033F71A7A
MSADWRWEYDPDQDHVAGGIPAHVVGEVERLADQLVDLARTGIDVSDLGNGPTVPGPAVCAEWTPPVAGSISWWLPGNH